jgi:hypothetical protein
MSDVHQATEMDRVVEFLATLLDVELNISSDAIWNVVPRRSYLDYQFICETGEFRKMTPSRCLLDIHGQDIAAMIVQDSAAIVASYQREVTR